MRLRHFIAIAVVFLSAASIDAQPLPKIQLQAVLTDLDKPLYITHHNTPALYIVQQSGKVLVYQDGQLRKKPFLDLSKKVNIDYECGLLSIAFHPDFARNGYIYADYTALMASLP